VRSAASASEVRSAASASEVRSAAEMAAAAAHVSAPAVLGVGQARRGSTRKAQKDYADRCEKTSRYSAVHGSCLRRSHPRMLRGTC
jgi:hypothetical protein